MTPITNDIRILHDYTVNVHYGPLAVEGHVVYIRHLTDTYDETSFDDLDNALSLSIANMRYVELLNHNAERLDTIDKVAAWDNRLKTELQYVAAFWNQWTDTNHYMNYRWMHRQIVYASVFSKCKADVATFHLLGCIVPYEKAKLDQLMYLYAQNSAEMFQNHPLVHSVTCYIDKSAKALLCYYRYVPSNVIIKAVYSLIDGSVSIARATSAVEYNQMEQEYNALKQKPNICYIGLNNQNKDFVNARDAILVELNNSKDPVMKDFASYLCVMQEA